MGHVPILIGFVKRVRKQRPKIIVALENAPPEEMTQRDVGIFGTHIFAQMIFYQHEEMRVDLLVPLLP